MSSTPVVQRRVPNFTGQTNEEKTGPSPHRPPPPPPPLSRSSSNSSTSSPSATTSSSSSSSNEHFKTFVVGVVIVFSYNLNLFFTTIAHELHPDDEDNAPLPDVILSNTTPRPWAFEWSEICVLLNVFVAVVVILLHASRWILLRRAIFIYSIINLYRALTVIVTILPNSVRGLECAPRLPALTLSGVFLAFLRVTLAFGFRIAGEPRTCGDWIFSGHTASMVWANLLVAEYAPKSVNRLLSFLVTLSTLTGTTLVLLSHDHYTIDCVIAYFLTTRAFWTYHSLCVRKCELSFLPTTRSSSSSDDPLRRVWWIKAFDYIEDKNYFIIENNFFWEKDDECGNNGGDVRKML